MSSGRRIKSPIWTPDSSRVLFGVENSGRTAFYEKRVADASSERKIMEFDDLSAQPQGFSNDGAWLMFSRIEPDTKWDVYRSPASGSGTSEALVKGRLDQRGVADGGSDSSPMRPDVSRCRAVARTERAEVAGLDRRCVAARLVDR